MMWCDVSATVKCIKGTCIRHTLTTEGPGISGEVFQDEKLLKGGRNVMIILTWAENKEKKRKK